MKFTNLELEVYNILLNKPATRGNNNVLYWEVVKNRLGDKAESLSAYDLLMYYKKSIPPFESITRVRRKVVEKDPSVGPNAEVLGFRKILENDYKDYART